VAAGRPAAKNPDNDPSHVSAAAAVSTVHCSVMQCTAVHCRVQYGTEDSSALQCSASHKRQRSLPTVISKESRDPRLAVWCKGWFLSSDPRVAASKNAGDIFW